MSFNIQRAIKKSKKYFIIFFSLWVVLAFIFVSPLAYGLVESNAKNFLDLGEVLGYMTDGMQHFFSTFGKVLSEHAGVYFDTLFKFTLTYIVIIIIGIWRAGPKHDYDDIEHGSSDWSEGGEQYSILSSKKGIILAEKNYLPVDKRGNTNVLVVGRIRVR